MLNQELLVRYPWKKVKNVPDPMKYTVTFEKDEGYFSEDNAENNIKIENGVLSIPVTENEVLSHVHVYEKNVTVTAKIRLTEAKPGAKLGLAARHNCDEAYVKLYYENDMTHWYIACREGADFPKIRHRIEYDHVPKKSAR